MDKNCIRVGFLLYIKDSLGGAERRLIRIYDEICRTEENIKCDVLIRCCAYKKAVDILTNANCMPSYAQIKCFRTPKECLQFQFDNIYDVIHFFDPHRFNVLSQIICKMKRRSSIFSVCAVKDAYGESERKRKITVYIQSKLANKIDLLYPSGFQHLSLYTRKNKISITPNTFTDLDVFYPKEKKKIMLYAAARLEMFKNPLLLVDAVNIVKDVIRESGYQIYILGKGELWKTLQDKIRIYEMGDIVQLLGYKKSSEYIPEAEVFFSLQQSENYPSQSLAEATACGCYLIITDVGDSRKCGDAGFCSFIDNKPESLAVAIKNYIIDRNNNGNDYFVDVSRSFAVKNYDINKSKSYFIKILEDLT